MTETGGSAALLKRQEIIERNNAVLRALGLKETVADFHAGFFTKSQTSRRTAPTKAKSSEPIRRSARAAPSKGSLAEDSFFPKILLDNIALKGVRVQREKMPAKQRTFIEWGEDFLFDDEATKENAEAWCRKIGRNSELKGKQKRAMRLAYRLSQEDVTFQSVRAKHITTEELMATAFGSSPQKLGHRSAMLRVLKEVEEGKIMYDA
jgi:hypothetical protein